MTFYDEELENNDVWSDDYTDDWGDLEEVETKPNLTEEEMAKIVKERKDDYQYMAPKHREVKKCIICNEDVQHDDNHKKTKCSHTFHKDCLECWLVIAKNCPCCKKNL